MTIRFILNGEDVDVNTDAEKRLITILREDFSLLRAKSGCLNGSCGACTVIFNSAISSACLIPAFRVQGSEIITLEGFSQTDEYQDIVTGFSRAGVETCGYCDAGKILTADALLARKPQPEKPDFLQFFAGIRCRCTEPESLFAGILEAGAIRQRRMYGRSS